MTVQTFDSKGHYHSTYTGVSAVLLIRGHFNLFQQSESDVETRVLPLGYSVQCLAE
jgi:hypothetical protein